jgi:VWFA-related protein
MKNRLYILLALFFGALRLVHAQPDASPDGPIAAVAGGARDRLEGLIKLDVTVTDSSGKPVAGLNAKNLRLLEDGREQRVLSFDAFTGSALGTEPPVKVILLLDTLQVPADLARDERNAVESFLRKDQGHLARPVSVFELTDSGLWTASHPATDGNVLAHELEHNELTLIRSNAGWHSSTGQFTSPVEMALKALGQITTDERRRPGRKLLLWIGPGWGVGTGDAGNIKRRESDLFGTITWFSDLLREAHLVLYSFGAGETDHHGQSYEEYLAGASSANKATLMQLNRNVLAVQSGGRVIEGKFDIEREIENCVRDDGPYYRISFDPFHAERLNEYHSLKVEVDEPGLSARTSTGYYDQPYYSTDQIPPPKRVSIEELQKILELDESDAQKAKQLSGLELTERLSERRLDSLVKIAHGKRTRQELRILTDASSFLNPPADEILADAPPDKAAQREMLALTSTYLKTTIHKLPDLFAKRSTTRYQETPMYLDSTSANYQPLHVTDSWATTIRYRNGHEVAETKPPKRKPNAPELITYGVFGPALNGVLDAIDKNSGLEWVRWERGRQGRLAVFRYGVPTEASLRGVGLCCLPDGNGTESFNRYAGYHEEVAIDPESGAILRLVVRTDLKSTTPITRSDVMIEYGPVDIGGTTYICPSRSVSIMRARAVRVLTDWDEWFRTYGPYSTLLNDVSFGGYHVFRSNSRILPEFTPPENK